MFNKPLSSSRIFLYAFGVVFSVCFINPMTTHAAAVQCVNGGVDEGITSCGMVSYVFVSGYCDYFGKGGDSSASSYVGSPDPGSITCQSEYFPAGTYTVGNYTAQIVGSSQGEVQVDVYHSIGSASIGGYSATAESADIASNSGGAVCTTNPGYDQQQVYAGGGDGLTLNLTSLMLSCIGYNASGATWRVLTAESTLPETDCLTKATSRSGQPGGYVPTAPGVCTFVPTNPPAKPLAAISVSATSVTLTQAQLSSGSVTIPFTYVNSGPVGSSVTITSCTWNSPIFDYRNGIISTCQGVLSN